MPDTIMTSLKEEEALLDFVRTAIEKFNSNFKYATYSNENYMALRYGIMEDCVKIIRIDPEWAPRNYQNVLKRKSEK